MAESRSLFWQKASTYINVLLLFKKIQSTAFQILGCISFKKRTKIKMIILVTNQKFVCDFMIEKLPAACKPLAYNF